MLACVPVSANDDRDQGTELDLDRELADLPCEFPDVPAPAVTDLDGNPVQENGPTLWDLRATRRAAFVHPAAGEDDSDVIELDMPARPTSRCRRELPASVPGLVTRARRRLRRRSGLRQREDASRMRDL
ncbi:hypothetical protein [uncultured Methylobacterium sp.]|uniref:hypothetical protein n=1 Tax=uncultured Methylobacterium sp. TaxID=157278 RepID=UPI00258E9DF4|nr:hypothetical protein [uncultured Methylobacterium sp.]